MKSFLLFSIIFTTIYVLVIVASSFFMFSFSSSKESLFSQFLDFICNVPISTDKRDGSSKRVFIYLLLNGIFWSVIVYFFQRIIMKVLSNKKT